ncbi:MinD/ParA family ATP-binding protein [Bythopirellula polymerisocia]|uniref:Flagellum site-determining protein YlxH n=1 Tax=Bythopirellula polymerisocia TaxID=2528003 RepID=A0A5C6CVD6_9BACT|nr:AAA family ATPase [Bythopirellula polymerisocia]TWU27785.1 Flagellum site-determining protein YlxH [Bythopirellula polymerisocia]
MLDQADKLRQLVRETVKEHTVLQPGVPMVAVSGARGGVGASAIALALALELAQLGKRVVLVDADLRAPRLTRSLSSSRNGGLADVMNGRRAVSEVLEQITEGVQLLPGSDVANEAAEFNPRAMNRMITELRSLTNIADVILIDAGAGMNPWVERFWTASLQILLLCTPQPSVVMDGYAALKLAPWVDVDGKLHLVVNQCSDPVEGMRVSDSFTSTCRRFLGMKLLGEAAVLPSEKQLSSGAATLSLRSPFRRSLRLLAADLLSQTHMVKGRIDPPQSRSHESGLQAEVLLAAVAQEFSA